MAEYCLQVRSDIACALPDEGSCNCVASLNIKFEEVKHVGVPSLSNNFELGYFSECDTNVSLCVQSLELLLI